MFDPEYRPHDPCMIFKVAKNREGRYEGGIKLWQAEECRGFVSNDNRKMTPFSYQQMTGVIKAVI